MNNLKKTKRGRPKTDTPMVRMPGMMVSEEQLKAYKAASMEAGKTFSAWVREALDKAANSEQ